VNNLNNFIANNLNNFIANNFIDIDFQSILIFIIIENPKLIRKIIRPRNFGIVNNFIRIVL
jgi:hypothetical protein